MTVLQEIFPRNDPAQIASILKSMNEDLEDAITLLLSFQSKGREYNSKCCTHLRLT